MFLHIYKYRLIQLFHEKENIMWIFLFPLILGTMFFAAFGNLINEDESFKAIPIAVVYESSNPDFEKIIDMFSQKNDDQLFTVVKTTDEEALTMLKEKEINGIIYSSEKPHLKVTETGINQSIIESFLDQYLQHSYMITEIYKSHPEKTADVISIMSSTADYSKQLTLTDNKMDILSQYFYALIAMTCLYASFIGLSTVTNIQANLSSLGARREVAPANKITVIFAEFFASVTVNYLSLLLLYFYLIVILKVDFGEKIPLILLATLFGSIIGVSSGTFIGSIGKGSLKVKEGLAIGFAMVCSFLSGLMFNYMKGIIENFCPLINRINPATLITDALYSLNMYDTYDRYIKDLVSMGIIAFIFCFSSFLILRRNKYANI